METLLQHLDSLSTNCHKESIKKINTKIPYAAVIVANCYLNTNMELGWGPIADAIKVAKLCHDRGIPVFTFFEAKGQEFVDLAQRLLRDVTDLLLLYFSGHGGQVKDLDGDEDDGYDELFFFTDSVIIDDMLLDLLYYHKNPKSRCILLSDCCHSGTIWDLDNPRAPKNCISISAALDNEEATQANRNGKEFGYFTDFLLNAIEEDGNVTPRQLKAILDRKFKKHHCHQLTQIISTTGGLIDQPLIPYGDEKLLHSTINYSKYERIPPPPHVIDSNEVGLWYDFKRWLAKK